MSGGGGGGGGQDPTYYYNIERDRQNAQMAQMRILMDEQRQAAERVRIQQEEQTRILQEQAAATKAEKEKQDAENAAKEAFLKERKTSRDIGGFNSWASNGYAGFTRTLGSGETLG